MRRPVSSMLFLLALAIAMGPGCSRAEEGESCDAGKGNEDCADGLVCRLAFEIKADESVCCPPPPGRPSTDPCKPLITEFNPDPHVDAATGSGGNSGTGGGSGSGGSSGSSGSAGADGGENDASDSAVDSASDAASDAAVDVNPG